MWTWLSRCFVILIPSVFVSGCGGNIFAGVPLGAALAGCSIQADANRMVPDVSGIAFRNPRYPISAVRTIGPEKSSVPPPILARTFRIALESSLQKANILQSHTDANHYILVAKIKSQNRQGSFSRTSFQLTVKYTLLLQATAEGILWETEITTTGEMKDWKTDACKRLRNLQESLSKKNIRRLLDELPIK